jgi:Mg-chelatase subunit ChlI
MSGVLVTPEFLQNVVGFATAANELMAKQASAETEIKTAAEKAVAALEKAGQLGGHKAEDLVAGIVAQPALALELITKMAEDAVVAKPAVEEKKKEKKAPAAEVPVAFGAAAEPEKAPKTASTSRESDDIWTKGFGF